MTKIGTRRWQSSWTWRATSFVCVVSPAFVGAAAAADFHSGKVITIIVSTDVGGTYDSYARIMADNMSRHIPGQPKMIVQNMPGAGGVKTANYMFTAAPKDGTVIAATYSSIPTGALLSQEGAQYDASKFNWLGSITKEPFVGFVWHEAPVQSWNDFYSKEVTMSTEAVGSASADFPIMSNAVLGTKVKIILGYKGAPESRLAIQRGEVMGNFATGFNSLRSQAGDMLRDHKYKIVIQHGLTKIDDLPDVPMLIDQARNDDDRRLLEVFLARQETGKPYFLPPGVPADRVALLRTAFAATLKDESFIHRVQQENMEMVGPMTGGEVETLVSRVLSAPPSIVTRIKNIFEDFIKSPR